MFWIVAQYGFLLSYMGKDLTGKMHQMEATSIQFGKLPDEDFSFPVADWIDIDKAGPRASLFRSRE